MGIVVLICFHFSAALDLFFISYGHGSDKIKTNTNVVPSPHQKTFILSILIVCTDCVVHYKSS